MYLSFFKLISGHTTLNSPPFQPLHLDLGAASFPIIFPLVAMFPILRRYGTGMIQLSPFDHNSLTLFNVSSNLSITWAQHTLYLNTPGSKVASDATAEGRSVPSNCGRGLNNTRGRPRELL